jgi:hypothetical protein
MLATTLCMGRSCHTIIYIHDELVTLIKIKMQRMGSHVEAARKAK